MSAAYGGLGNLGSLAGLNTQALSATSPAQSSNSSSKTTSSSSKRKKIPSNTKCLIPP
jgi:hypothetical protein